MGEQVNPGDLCGPENGDEKLSPEKVNQVQIHTKSGKVHEVQYALRHPEMEWIYANRVTSFDIDETRTNDLVFRADHVESIESDHIHPESLGRDPDRSRVTAQDQRTVEASDRMLVHYSGQIENIELDELWKAGPLPAEALR